MVRRLLSLGLVLATVFAFALPAWADDGPMANSLKWLKTQQQPDGGFTNGFSEGSDLGTTCDVILAIAAAGQDVNTWVSKGGNTPLDYLKAQLLAGAVKQVSQKAKVVLALLAVDEDPAQFGGHDLLAELNAAYDDTTGSYGGNLFDQALVILALTAAGQAVPEAAVDYLLDRQAEDGAWALFGDTQAGAGDTNTTALVLQALAAVGRKEGVTEALAYLRKVQNEDGGFPYQKPSQYGTDTDANSTAVVLQALMALGEDLDDWAPADSNPLEALEALYDPSSGAFLWQAAVPGANVLATAQAIPALAGYTFVQLPLAPASAPTATTLPASGGFAATPIVLLILGAGAVSAGLALHRRK